MRLTFLMGCIFFTVNVYSQELFFPLHRGSYILLDNYTDHNDSLWHSSIKPYLNFETNKNALRDSLYKFNLYPIIPSSRFNKCASRILNKDLVYVYKNDFKLIVNPIFDFSLGKDFINGKSTYINARGFQLNSVIDNLVYISSGFIEQQASFPDYVDTLIKTYKVVPGQGKIRKFKSNGFDYAMSNGYVSISPLKFMNIQFGHDKNFIGDGYRSLLLSDNSFNYPFLKVTSTYKRMKYLVMFCEFQNISYSAPITYLGKGFQKKYGTFHYLNIATSNKFQFGLFDAVLWKTSDSTSLHPFELKYLNPIIFVHHGIFSLGELNNSLLGFNYKWKLLNGLHIYGQFVLDEFKYSGNVRSNMFLKNKSGVQLGLVKNNLVGINNLRLQLEFNQVSPFTYAHKSPTQSYTHYNQPLAHPLGANFRELLFFMNYSCNRFFYEFKCSRVVFGTDSAGTNYGKNIFLSELSGDILSNAFPNGIKSLLTHLNLMVTYLINKQSNLRLEANVTYRNIYSNPFQKSNTFYFSFGVKSLLQNVYYDF